jgi:hypothetical protein
MIMERSTTQSNMACRRHIGLAPILRSNSGKPFLLEFNMKTIPLTQGKFAIVDDEDYEELSKHKWFANRDHKYDRWYATRSVWDKNTHKCKSSQMHRVIMKTPVGMHTDHINHDGLDNRKCNLRICSNSQNQCNRLDVRGTSKYKGVHWSTGNRRWIAQIVNNGKKEYIGGFLNEIFAANAYDQKAKEVFGEYACLNFKTK